VAAAGGDPGAARPHASAQGAGAGPDALGAAPARAAHPGGLALPARAAFDRAGPRSLERELARFARGDRRCLALQTLFGVGPILACHLLAEIGDARRFRRARQVVRLSGLDPSVSDSADSSTRGRLAKAGPPALRWALVQAAQHGSRERSPDRRLHAVVQRRCGSQRAKLTVARKIARRAFHVLRDLEAQAA
jgi:transposase